MARRVENGCFPTWFSHDRLPSALLGMPPKWRHRSTLQGFDLFLTSRTCGGLTRVKSTTSSPVVVLMSWCKFSAAPARAIVRTRRQDRTRLCRRAPQRIISIEEKNPLAFAVVLPTISFVGRIELHTDPKKIPDPSRRTTRGRATRLCRGAR